MTLYTYIGTGRTDDKDFRMGFTDSLHKEFQAVEIELVPLLVSDA